MEQRKKVFIFAGLVILAIVLFGVGLSILPDVLVMQITSSGAAGTTMPKAVGLAIPLALTAVFGFLWYKGDESKYLLIAALGVVLNLVTFFMNL